MKILQPDSWIKPKGYSNGIEAQGRLIFLAGQIGWDKNQKIVSSEIVAQTKQALINIKELLEVGGANTMNLVRLTWFVTNKHEYLKNQKEIGLVYREVIGNHYPSMSLIEVKSLLENDAKVEIEATAVV